MKNSTLIALLVVCLVILLAGTYQPQNEEKTTIVVGGMHCDNCVNKVQSALVELKGVKKSSVDLGKSEAEITYDPTVVKLEDLETVIAGIGFTVGSKSENAKSHKMSEMDGCCKKGETSAKCSADKKIKGPI